MFLGCVAQPPDRSRGRALSLVGVGGKAPEFFENEVCFRGQKRDLSITNASQLDNSPEILQFLGFLLIQYCNYPIYIWDLRVALGLGFELGARIRYRDKASAWVWDCCI